MSCFARTPLQRCTRLCSYRLMQAIGLLALLPVTLLNNGCTPGAALPIDGGAIGVTLGGEQDVADARSRILAGGVPIDGALTVEGFLSEHEIPLAEPDNAEEFFVTAGATWRQPFDAVAPLADVFINLGTTIDLDAFERGPLNLVLAVDRSGSMDFLASATDFRTRLDAVKQALHSLLDRLNADDRVAMVSFNHRIRIEAATTAGDDLDRIRNRINRMRPENGTDLFGGMAKAFEQIDGGMDPSRENRVIVFTDALPTKGDVGDAGFGAYVNLVRFNADRGVGLTMMAVGQFFGNDLVDALSSEPLANAFYLSDADRVARIFEDEFDFLTTPAAHDLVLDIAIPDGIGIRDIYGVPDYVPGTNGASVRVPTVFFSRREGTGIIVIRLTFAETPTFDEEVLLGQASLRYTLPDGTTKHTGGELMLPAALSPEADPAYFSEPSMRRAAVLLDTARVLIEASVAARQDRQEDAVAMIENFLAEFDKATLGMSDRTDPTSRGLSDERRVLEALLGTIRSGSFYFW